MTPQDMDLTPEQAAALDAAMRNLVKRRGVTDCIMFGLDEYGQVWEKRLQDSKWQKTKMTPEEGSNE